MVMGEVSMEVMEAMVDMEVMGVTDCMAVMEVMVTAVKRLLHGLGQPSDLLTLFLII